MQKGVLALLVFLLGRAAGAQVVLSEIMFNPSGNERYDEFVELYNAGEIEAVDLTGWLLSDSSKFNLILPYAENAILKPHHFAIILVPNYFEKSRIYDAEIPDDALLLTIGAAQIGAYGLKNSAGERVSLHRPDSSMVAAFKYTPDNKDGFSEEKIDLLAGDAPENWSNSVKHGGTPGYKNSAAPSSYDIMLTSLTMTPKHPGADDSLTLHLGVKNVGKKDADYFDVEIAANHSEFIFSDRFDCMLPPGDSIVVHVSTPPFPMGEHTLTARLFFDKDENKMNNELELALQVVAAYPPGSVVINEIMYDTDEKTDEWLELFNASADSVLLKGWTISDKRKSVIICDSLLYVPPDRYCLLANHPLHAADSLLQLVLSLPELNNSGDELALRDATGALIDSVAYTREFGGERNVSLERIRYENSSAPENWGACRDSLGSTPGRCNSVSPRAHDASIDGASFQAHPQRPSSGEQVTLSVRVVNSGREPAENIRVDFSYTPLATFSFQALGSQTIASLAPDEYALVKTMWSSIPAGVYVVRAEATMTGDRVKENNTTMDTLVVSDTQKPLAINEIMYSPVDGMAEWVELFNRGDYAAPFFGYAIGKSDSTQCVPVCSEPLDIAAGGFVVIAHDSSIVDLCDAPVFVLRTMPSLKNDADDLRLYDGNGRLADHLAYSNKMGGAKGRSLERINPNVDSAERTNWTTCVSEAGHTCGLRNSVTMEIMPETVSLTVQPNPFSPDGDGIDDFVGISYSLPATTAQVNIKIYDIAGRPVRFLLNNKASGAQRTIFWDGANDEGRRCTMGVYIIFLEALNKTALCVERAQKTVVLAGAL